MIGGLIEAISAGSCGNVPKTLPPIMIGGLIEAVLRQRKDKQEDGTLPPIMIGGLIEALR